MATVLTLNSEKRATVLEAAKVEHVKVKHLCKRGFCGKCTVKVIEGELSEPNEKEIKKLGKEKISEGFRLGCQATFTGTVKLEQ